MRINTLEINQDGNVFYVGKIKAADLVSFATTKVRKANKMYEFNNYLEEVEETTALKLIEKDIWYLKDMPELNIQRAASKKRLSEIGEYISKANSIFPNSIIINLSLKDGNNLGEKDIFEIVNIGDNYIEFDENEITATIIDGQHRLGGFNYTDDKQYYLENFELIVTIMIGLEISQQAELFSTINGKQKAVNKSVLYDLTEVSESEYTELVTSHLVAKWFNINDASPLKNKIKMLGTGEGTVSQSAFIDAFMTLIQEKDLKVEKIYSNNFILPVFRQYYLDGNTKAVIKHLYDYFKSFKELFNEEWEFTKPTYQSDKKFILNKSTGISALIYAFPIIYVYLKQSGNVTYHDFYSLLYCLKQKNFDFSSEKYSGGGKQLQRNLAENILNTIFDQDQIMDLKNDFVLNKRK